MKYQHTKLDKYGVELLDALKELQAVCKRQELCFTDQLAAAARERVAMLDSIKERGDDRVQAMGPRS